MREIISKQQRFRCHDRPHASEKKRSSAEKAAELQMMMIDRACGPGVAAVEAQKDKEKAEFETVMLMRNQLELVNVVLAFSCPNDQ